MAQEYEEFDFEDGIRGTAAVVGALMSNLGLTKDQQRAIVEAAITGLASAPSAQRYLRNTYHRLWE